MFVNELRARPYVTSRYVVLFNVTAAVAENPRLFRSSSRLPNSGMFVPYPVVPPPYGIRLLPTVCSSLP